MLMNELNLIRCAAETFYRIFVLGENCVKIVWQHGRNTFELHAATAAAAPNSIIQKRYRH